MSTSAAHRLVGNKRKPHPLCLGKSLFQETTPAGVHVLWFGFSPVQAILAEEGEPVQRIRRILRSDCIRCGSGSIPHSLLAIISDKTRELVTTTRTVVQPKVRAHDCTICLEILNRDKRRGTAYSIGDSPNHGLTL